MSKPQKKAIAPNVKKLAAKIAKGKEAKKPAKVTKPTTQETGKNMADVKEAGCKNSKQNTLISLLERSGGATVEEMATATGWQNHSVLGAISGVLKKRLGLTVASEKEERGRVYRIAGAR